MTETNYGLLGRILQNYQDARSIPQKLAGLLAQVPQNARTMVDEAKTIPQQLAGLLSPQMNQRVNAAINKPASANPQQWIEQGMNLAGMAPVGGLIGQTVYHGSPHKFDKFDMSKIGTGEGAQAYGHGLYFAESPDVAKSYLKAGGGGKQLTVTLPNNQSLYGDQITDNGLEAIKYLERGAQDAGQFKHNTAYYAKRYTQDPDVQKLIDEWKDAKVGYKDHSTFYKVDIPDESIPRMLDWDKPLSEQSPEVQAALEKLGFTSPWEVVSDTGHALPRSYKSQQEALLDAQKMGGSIQQRAGTHKGSSIYSGLLNDEVTGASLSPSQISEKLNNSGIPGIRYLDGSSRNAGQGTSNFVLFDDQLPRITEINGQPTGLLPWSQDPAALAEILKKYGA